MVKSFATEHPGGDLMKAKFTLLQNKKRAVFAFKGGKGSGFVGHAGRPGEVGGSTNISSGKLKVIKTFNDLMNIAKDKELYIRWSRGPELDKLQKYSLDQVSGIRHSGLSSQRVYGDDPSKAAMMVQEYSMLRRKDPKIYGYVFTAERVGTDSDGAPTIDADTINPIGRMSNELINSCTAYTMAYWRWARKGYRIDDTPNLQEYLSKKWTPEDIRNIVLEGYKQATFHIKPIIYKGGKGSGFKGHLGRPGEVGGSSSGEGGNIANEVQESTALYNNYKNDPDTKVIYSGSNIVGFYNGKVQSNPPERIRNLVGNRPYVLAAIATFEQGHGREIMTNAIKDAISAHASGLVLYSDTENASGFYEHIGLKRSPNDNSIFYMVRNDLSKYKSYNNSQVLKEYKAIFHYKGGKGSGFKGHAGGIGGPGNPGGSQMDVSGHVAAPHYGAIGDYKYGDVSDSNLRSLAIQAEQSARSMLDDPKYAAYHQYISPKISAIRSKGKSLTAKAVYNVISDLTLIATKVEGNIIKQAIFHYKGGKGSGFVGHAGRPGEVGGSSSGGFNSILTQRTEHVGHAYGQDDYMMTAYTKDGQIAATLNYSVFEDKPYIDMVEAQQHGLGAGKSLVQSLANEYGYKNILWGMMTEDGYKLQKKLDGEYNVIREVISYDAKKLSNQFGGKNISSVDTNFYALFTNDKVDNIISELNRIGATNIDIQEGDGEKYISADLPESHEVVISKQAIFHVKYIYTKPIEGIP